MKLIFTVLLFLFFQKNSFSQAFFTSNSTGDWNSPSSWSLVSGTSSTNYPVAGDSVIIQNSHSIDITANSQCESLTVKTASALTFNNTNSILTVSNNVLITEASTLTLNAGAFSVSGNLTVNQSSSLTQNGGGITIVGLIFITAPPSGSGTSLLNIDAGLFTCAGGLTLSAGINSSRVAELKIGNSATNVFGILTTTTANSKITFTGIGALTLAGIITIPNATSFTAGNGRVVYAGVPGINQVVAPLTYNRLVITGVGSGSKTINGTATVTDTLTLLSDTLQLGGSGILRLNNNATIVKTRGKLLSAPTFLGQIDLLYNNVVRDTTGLEMPTATNVLRNLYINDVLGITMTSNITLSNQLSLQNGELNTNTFVLNITNPEGGISTDPAIDRTNGFVNGFINRTIGTSLGIRIFPFGIGLLQGYREFKIDYTTAPTIAGSLTVQHFNTAASAQSGFPLLDGAISLVNSAGYYWQADAVGGLSGGTYSLTLTAEGAVGVNDYTTLRTLKRPSAGGAWVLDGIAGTNTGTNAAPVVVRTGMSNFSQFTIGGSAANPLPLRLLTFSGQVNDQNIVLDWKTTNEVNTDYFIVEKNTDGNIFKAEGKIISYNIPSSIHHYQYKVENLVNGKYFFRLKMVDNDGKYTYSNVIAISINSAMDIKVYPTISNSIINISSTTFQKFFLYNSSGQFIKNLVIGQNDISALVSGLYFIKCNDKILQIIKQ